MSVNNLERFSTGDITWTARRCVRRDIENIFGNSSRLEEGAGAELVKATPGRIVWRAPLPERTLYIKCYRTRDRLERSKYFFARPRAAAEWRAALRLRAAGIEAAEPLALGRLRRNVRNVDTFFIAAELPGDRFDAVAADLRSRGENLQPLLREAVRLHGALLDAGVVHRDLHGGNMLVRFENDLPRIGLVDLHSMRFSPGSPRRRSRDRVRAKLAHSLWLALEDEEFRDALRLLAPGETEEVRRAVDRLEQTRLRSRSKRCVRASTLFVRDRRNGWTVWRRRSVELDALLALASQRQESGAPIAAGRIPVGSTLRTVRLQRASHPGWQGQLSGWKGAHALHVRGIPGRVAYACMHRWRFGLLREAILVTEQLAGAIPLDQIPNAQRSQTLMKAALDTVQRHHRFGLRVGIDDLCALPDGDGWRVLRCEFEGTPPDLPLETGIAARDIDAIRAATAPLAAPGAP